MVFSLSNLDFNKRIGFLFGSEASGLTNNEITYANCTMQIPANPNFKSLNLSHSVIIVAQVVSSLIELKKSKYRKSKKIKSESESQPKSKKIHNQSQNQIKSKSTSQPESKN